MDSRQRRLHLRGECLDHQHGRGNDGWVCDQRHGLPDRLYPLLNGLFPDRVVRAEELRERLTSYPAQAIQGRPAQEEVTDQRCAAALKLGSVDIVSAAKQVR